eukprot:468840_1
MNTVNIQSNPIHFKQNLNDPLFAMMNKDVNTQSPSYSTSASSSTITSIADNMLNCDNTVTLSLQLNGPKSLINNSHNKDMKARLKQIKKDKKNGFKRDKHTLSVKEISNNLQSLFNQMNPETNNIKDLNVLNSINLKMIRNTRSTRSIRQLWKRIQSINQCECGNTVAIINGIKHKDTQYQVYGIINEICSDYMSVLIPTNYLRKEFIQRKMYNFEIRNSKYGAVYLIPNKSAH